MISFVFCAMTGFVLALLLFPLLRARTAAPPMRADHEVAVYRHQLAELERENAHGFAPPEHVAGLRLEIQRRLLSAAEDCAIPTAQENRRINTIAAAVIVVGFIAGAWGLYAYLGSPNLPDEPFAARQNDPDMQLKAVAEIAAAELAAHPDAGGYEKLAEMYYALRLFDRSAETYQKALDLNGKDAEAWSGLGESVVMENDGAVAMDAQDAFKKALALDKAEPRARFYMGLAEAQIGNLKKAVAIWRDLEKTAPANALWLSMVKENIAVYSKLGGFEPASVAPAPLR